MRRAHTMFQKGRGQQAKGGSSWIPKPKNPSAIVDGLCLSSIKIDLTEKISCKFSCDGFYTGVLF